MARYIRSKYTLKNTIINIVFISKDVVYETPEVSASRVGFGIIGNKTFEYMTAILQLMDGVHFLDDPS